MARAFPFLAAVLGLVAGAAASAGTLRIATYNTDLSADGPGVLLYDLGRDPDETLTAVIAVIQATSKSSHGHIQGYDGTRWISDFVQAAF